MQFKMSESVRLDEQIKVENQSSVLDLKPKFSIVLESEFDEHTGDGNATVLLYLDSKLNPWIEIPFVEVEYTPADSNEVTERTYVSVFAPVETGVDSDYKKLVSDGWTWSDIDRIVRASGRLVSYTAENEELQYLEELFVDMKRNPDHIFSSATDCSLYVSDFFVK